MRVTSLKLRLPVNSQHILKQAEALLCSEPAIRGMRRAYWATE